jgi:hypothetical protein
MQEDLTAVLRTSSFIMDGHSRNFSRIFELKQKERKWNNPQCYLPARETPEINQQKTGYEGTRGKQSKYRTNNCVELAGQLCWVRK